MPSYKAPVEEVLFLLRDVFPIQRYNNLPGFAEATPDVVEAIVSEAAKLCEETLEPLNQPGDRAGCVRGTDGSVATPRGFKEAYRAFVEGGWVGLAADPDYGGQGLPYTLAAIVNEFASSANMAFAMYPGLSQGALAVLLTHGTGAQKTMFVPKLISGDWSGTMNLTESHCGTDLGLLKTKAVPNGDGSYAIFGEKIFISAGEHDLAENIIHLVLARIEGAPAGVKGISLFVVPKILIEADGSLGPANKVTCGAIEHK
ncbi:MAG: acyl-CoA dehydrogenase family protein, partial [Methylocella sp.]